MYQAIFFYSLEISIVFSVVWYYDIVIAIAITVTVYLVKNAVKLFFFFFSISIATVLRWIKIITWTFPSKA